MKTNSIINRIAAGALAIVVAIGVYLNVPPPRHAHAFEATSTWGGTAGGTANALTVSIYNLQSLNDILGVPIRFNPSANNTGPVTIAVGGLAATAVQRPSSLGLVAFSLNEFWAGETTAVTYNGSVFVLTDNVDMQRVGSTCEFRGAGAPRGCIIEDGSCISQSQFSALYAVLGTLYGTCSGGNFKLPRSNGTGFVAFDGQGANGAAGVLTSNSCGAPNSPILCGNETVNIAQSGLPNVSVPVTSNGVSANAPNNSSSPLNLNSGSGASFTVFPAATFLPASIALNGGVTQTRTITLPPVIPGIRAIKY